MFALSIQRCINCSLVPIRPAPNDGEIFFFQSLFLHQETEFSRDGGRFRDKHESARLAIEPIHNRNLAAIRDLEGEQFAQLFPQSRLSIRFRRVHKKIGRLVDDKVIVGLVDNRDIR